MTRAHLQALPLLLALGLSSAMARVESPVTAEAQDASTHIPEGVARSPQAEPARQALKAVLEGPDFEHKKTTRQLRFKYDWFKDWKWEKDKSQKTNSPLPFVDILGNMVGFIVGHALWLLALAVILAAVWYRRKWLPLLQRLGLRIQQPSPAVAEVTESDEPVLAPLPDDILSAAEREWQRGDRRSAFSLLYRGAVQSLQLPVPATEQENLRQVRQQQTPEVIDSFTQITRAWLDTAWAGHAPDSFNRLTDAYRRHFQRRTGP
ncbi:MAG: hypothetical protein Q7T36_03000 [Fluviicoccus sp.]|uniref:hypothetical protein n=1 Tax=Fluviicoccus sp. TaxID=2003552 RepID=UPI00271C4F05|nr:hypothetical protein [Fluviicoccus sp.]MDO8329415.1 hypothetical protein [Fluviicoccus sp.]